MSQGVGRKDPEQEVLKGTTLRVYRFIFRSAKPQSVRDVQRGLGLSSISLADYHLAKLLHAGLIREADSGYTVDKIVLDNMVRIRRQVIPVHGVFGIFFLTSLIVLLTFFYEPNPSPVYVYALVVNSVALGLSLYEVIRTLSSPV